nr:hypothetical protein [Tanacetum cinerariifolium]
LSAVSESGSHVTAAVSGSVYSATVAVSEAGTPVYTLAHRGSEAHGAMSGTASARSIQVSLIPYPTSLIPWCLISASTASANP